MEEKPAQAIIDARALDRIADIALSVFHDTRRPVRTVILLEALHTYLTERGIAPGFVVSPSILPPERK